MYPDELYHHGILGQKWGVRRFQNRDGSLTDAGKKRYGINPIMAIKDARTKSKRKKALEKARKTRELNKIAKEDITEKKKEWVKSAKTLSEHIDEFTNEEISEALTRLRLLDQVEEMKFNRVKRGVNYISQFGNTAKSINEISKMISTVNKTYNDLFPKDNSSSNNGGGKKKGSGNKQNTGNNNGSSGDKKEPSKTEVLQNAVKELTDKAADKLALSEKDEEKEDE